MKYIAKYPRRHRDAAECQQRHDDEFYRKAHNVSSGRKVGEFVQTRKGLREFSYQDYTAHEIENDFVRRVVGELFPHLEKIAQKSEGGVSALRLENCLPKAVLPSAIPGWEEWQTLLEIGAGYTAWISDDEVVAEAYVACSGNWCAIIHKEDHSILFVDSKRHGIPELALEYREEDPLEVLQYASWRTDARWWESGLAPDPDSRDYDEYYPS